VLTTSLQGGFGEGLRVACSPLVSDSFVNFLVLVVLYSCLVGLKVALATRIAASRKWLVGAWHRRLLRGAGALLLLAGAALIMEAGR
jgi:threonine/homoserine/homoserine lactone efflux protein